MAATRKIDLEELHAYRTEHPDYTEETIAKEFGVTQSCIWKNLKKLSKERPDTACKMLSRDHSLYELLEGAMVCDKIDLVYIRVKNEYIKALRHKLLVELGKGKRNNKHGILEIRIMDNGLLIVSDDLMLAEKIKALQNND